MKVYQILTVEPDADWREIFDEAITRYRLPVIFIHSDHQAVHAIQNLSPFAMILVTNELGEGKRLIHSIRTNGWATRIIGMSVDAENQDGMISVGADDFWLKSDEAGFAPIIGKHLPPH